MQKLLNDKKGITLGEVPRVVLIMGIAGVIGVILLLVVEEVSDSANAQACASRTDSLTTYNTTADVCQNTTNQANVGTFGANASDDSQAGIGEVFEQFDIVGLVVGLGIVLVIVLGVFAGRTNNL